MKRSATKQDGESASQLISKRIAELGDWRGETLAQIRALIKEADRDILEEWKWMGTPVWSDNGIVCTGETYKSVVKMTFAKGAFLKDPSRLFNSSLEGNMRRAIDVHEGEEIDAVALKALFREAVALNASGKKPAGLKASGRKAAGLKASEKQVAGVKASEKKASGKKASGLSASGKKAAAQKASDKKPAGVKASRKKPARKVSGK